MIMNIYGYTHTYTSNKKVLSCCRFVPCNCAFPLAIFSPLPAKCHLDLLNCPHSISIGLSNSPKFCGSKYCLPIFSVIER